LMRTKDGVSPHTAGPLALTLVLFIVVYFSVFGVGIGYIFRLVRKGPTPFKQQHGGPGQERQPMRPISAADESDDIDDTDDTYNRS